MEAGDWVAVAAASFSTIVAALALRSRAQAAELVGSLSDAKCANLIGEDVTVGGGAAELTAHGPMADGDWVAITGNASTSEEPLVALNGSKAALVLEEVSTTSISSTGSGIERRKDVLSRSWREVPWFLLGDRPATILIRTGPLSESTVSRNAVAVAPDAVRAAFQKDPTSVVDGLQSGGISILSSSPPWYVDIALALLGVLDRQTLQQHFMVPLGLPLTVVGKLRVRDGNATLELHPRLGLQLFRGPIDEWMQRLVSRRRWSTLQASLAVAGASFVTWLALIRLRYIVTDGWDGTLRGALSCAMSSQWQWPAGHDSADAGTAGAWPTVVAVPVPLSPLYGSDTPAATPDAECVVCRERAIVVSCVPCGHLCMCGACAERLMSRAATEALAVGEDRQEAHCPMCRCVILQCLRVHHV